MAVERGRGAAGARHAATRASAPWRLFKSSGAGWRDWADAAHTTAILAVSVEMTQLQDPSELPELHAIAVRPDESACVAR